MTKWLQRLSALTHVGKSAALGPVVVTQGAVQGLMIPSAKEYAPSLGVLGGFPGHSP